MGKTFNSKAEFQAYAAKYIKLADDAAKKIDGVIAAFAKVRGKLPNKLGDGFSTEAAATYAEVYKAIIASFRNADQYLRDARKGGMELADRIKREVTH